MQNELDNIKNATQETFWSVLSRYTISIPRMQRDYAQGRIESDVEQKKRKLIE